jgi:hypothetical protein
MSRVYCENCANWFQSFLMEREGCRYVISVDPEHPVRPQEVYGNHEELNKNGDCPHYKPRKEGLGIVGGLEDMEPNPN